MTVTALEITPVERFAAFLQDRRRIFVLTGAGCSTESGIPDYRGPSGNWRSKKPMLISEFMRSEENRRHYWARNFRGWPRFSAARPNSAHFALARMETQQRLTLLVTQNVDGLHQAAGSRSVVDLHGRADRVICTSCGARISRAQMQLDMERLNGPGETNRVTIAPDSDAELSREDTEHFIVPPCTDCGGALKPDVVFFGDSVPKRRVEEAMDALHSSDAMVVVGSSLAVWSGYRFAVAAAKSGIPIAAITEGWTRADELIELKVEQRCGQVLPHVAAALE